MHYIIHSGTLYTGKYTGMRTYLLVIKYKSDMQEILLLLPVISK